jgi:YgiT-type zinc finger domain-containing protein
MNLCPYCRTGFMRRRAMAYIQWHGQALLLVERMPAFVCDKCGEVSYDSEAVENLQRLLWAAPLGNTDRPHPGLV